MSQKQCLVCCAGWNPCPEPHGLGIEVSVTRVNKPNMFSISSSLHHKRGSNCVSPMSVQRLLHRRCWASHTWPNNCSCLVRLSIAPWILIRSSSDVTPYSSHYPTEVSDLVTILSTELVPPLQIHRFGYVTLRDSAHFYHSPQMAKGLRTCSTV